MMKNIFVQNLKKKFNVDIIKKYILGNFAQFIFKLTQFISHQKLITLVVKTFNDQKITIEKFYDHYQTEFHKYMLCTKIILLLFILKNFKILSKHEFQYTNCGKENELAAQISMVQMKLQNRCIFSIKSFFQFFYLKF